MPHKEKQQYYSKGKKLEKKRERSQGKQTDVFNGMLTPYLN